MTREEFAHYPNCPNTAEFKRYIDNPNEVYVYNPETNTAALKVTLILEVTLTGKANSDSGPGILAFLLCWFHGCFAGSCSCGCSCCRNVNRSWSLVDI